MFIKIDGKTGERTLMVDQGTYKRLYQMFSGEDLAAMSEDELKEIIEMAEQSKDVADLLTRRTSSGN